MGYTVDIDEFGAPLKVEADKTILEAALESGLSYPHGCRSGNCGSCKSKLVSGDVEIAPYSDFALTAEERARGLILACRAMPRSDCAIVPLDVGGEESHPVRDLGCTVLSADPATHDIRVVRLKVLSGGPFSFAPGQYAAVTFPGLPPRDYSMANRPGGDTIEFHIRLVEDGAVTPYVQDRLTPGDPVRVQGPYGTSYLRRGHRGPILALAGGSGLAPIKAIVESALDAGMGQGIYLYFGVRDERDLYLESHFQALIDRHPNLKFIPVLSEPATETRHRTGFLHDAVRLDFTDLDGCKAYLAGPPPMVEAATGILTGLGVRHQDCHADAFYTEADKAAGKGV